MQYFMAETFSCRFSAVSWSRSPYKIRNMAHDDDTPSSKTYRKRQKGIFHVAEKNSVQQRKAKKKEERMKNRNELSAAAEGVRICVCAQLFLPDAACSESTKKNSSNFTPSPSSHQTMATFCLTVFVWAPCVCHTPVCRFWCQRWPPSPHTLWWSLQAAHKKNYWEIFSICCHCRCLFFLHFQRNSCAGWFASLGRRFWNMFMRMRCFVLFLMWKFMCCVFSSRFSGLFW